MAYLYKTASLHLHYFLDWLYSKRRNDNNNVQLCNQSILLTNTTQKTHFVIKLVMFERIRIRMVTSYLNIGKITSKLYSKTS